MGGAVLASGRTGDQNVSVADPPAAAQPPPASLLLPLTRRGLLLPEILALLDVKVEGGGSGVGEGDGVALPSHRAREGWW